MTDRVAKSAVREDGSVALLAPSVGLVRGLAELGDVVVAGRAFAALETLGRVERLIAPPGVGGRVVSRLPGAAARLPAGFGTELLAVDPRAATESVAAGGVGGAASTASLVFRAPMSGRFYARPSPAKPPLVEVGQIIAIGEAVGLLEVMKTFNRVVYGGEGVPARARVLRIVPADGDDVARSAVLIELEAV